MNDLDETDFVNIEAPKAAGADCSAATCSGLRCATLLCGAQAVWGEFMTFDLGRTEKLMNRACQTCYDRNVHPYLLTLHGWRKLDSQNAEVSHGCRERQPDTHKTLKKP